MIVYVCVCPYLFIEYIFFKVSANWKGTFFYLTGSGNDALLVCVCVCCVCVVCYVALQGKGIRGWVSRRHR